MPGALLFRPADRRRIKVQESCLVLTAFFFSAPNGDQGESCLRT